MKSDTKQIKYPVHYLVHPVVHSHGNIGLKIQAAIEEQLKMQYNTPKIYPKIVSLKSASKFSNKQKRQILKKHKRWYVYYSYINPENNKLTRQPNIFYNINSKFKTFDSRLHYIKIIRNATEKLLKEGYNPYSKPPTDKYSAGAALDFVLDLKKGSLKATSLKDYQSRVNQFKTFLSQKSLIHGNIDQINKSVITDYLNMILKTSSPRNRNNTRAILSSIFTTLVDNDLIDRNFITSIKPLPAQPIRNKTYTPLQVEGIYAYLKENNQQLLLFIKVVSYNYLRPIEVVRLQIQDIDLPNKRIHVKAKNQPVKIKIIPGILMEDLNAMRLNNYKNTDYLFSPNGPGPWPAGEIQRRNYFTKQYKKVKQDLNLDINYTIYSFRHTFITKLYQEIRAKYSTIETISKLMLITGHSTQKALQQYLRTIDAELPEDYSKYLL